MRGILLSYDFFFKERAGPRRLQGFLELLRPVGTRKLFHLVLSDVLGQFSSAMGEIPRAVHCDSEEGKEVY